MEVGVCCCWGTLEWREPGVHALREWYTWGWCEALLAQLQQKVACSCTTRYQFDLHWIVNSY